MDMQFEDLTPAQQRDLKRINQWSKGGMEFCKIDSFDSRVIKNLETKNLIVVNRNEDGTVWGRVTGRGKKVSGASTSTSVKVRSFQEAEPGEREVTHGNDQPHPWRGPYPARNETGEVGPGSTDDGASSKAAPRAPVVPDLNPGMNLLDEKWEDFDIEYERLVHLQTLGAIMLSAGDKPETLNDARGQLDEIYDLANGEWKLLVQVIDTDQRRNGGKSRS